MILAVTCHEMLQTPRARRREFWLALAVFTYRLLGSAVEERLTDGAHAGEGLSLLQSKGSCNSSHVFTAASCNSLN